MGRKKHVETGVRRQADGAVILRSGDTISATAVAAKKSNPETDFFFNSQLSGKISFSR